MMRFPGFVGPGYTLQSLAADCQRCVNWFPELNELQAAADGEIGSLVQAPGYSLTYTLGKGPLRGAFATSLEQLFFVSGNTLYQVSIAGVITIIGVLNTSSGSVSMADNGVQLLVGDGPYGYLYDFTTQKFSMIVADGFTGAATCAYQDGYFIVNPPGTNTFSISALYDGTSWSGLDFGAAEGSPDLLVACVDNLRQLWLMGAETIEVWWNSGDANFPFARIDGAFIEYGCAAPQAAKKFDNSIVWLGGGARANGVIWTADGFRPRRISNHAVEYAIQQCVDLSTATAYVYQSNGHSFYVLNLPDSKTSWVYDSSIQQWHERQSWVNGDLRRQSGDVYAFCFGKHFVGDYSNGNVYTMDYSVFTDNGNPLVRIRRSPHLSAGMVRQFFSQFILDATVGVGLDGSPVVGAVPQIGLSWSDDYGFTWSPEILMPLGGIGQYRTRVLWNRLGMGRNRVFQVRISDPVRVTLLGAELELQAGAS